MNTNQGNELHVLLNRSGQIVRISDSMIYFTEIPQTEIIGKPWFEIFIPPQIRETILIGFNNIMNGIGHKFEKFQNPIIGKGQLELMFEWDNQLIYDDSDNIIGVYSTGKLISLNLEKSTKNIALIVDDEEDLLEIYKNCVSQNLIPVAFTDSHLAIDYFLKNSDNIAMVLIDQYMPKVQGREIAITVKSRNPETPILLVTGYPDLDSKSHFLYNKTHSKPFEVHEISDWFTDQQSMN